MGIWVFIVIVIITLFVHVSRQGKLSEKWKQYRRKKKIEKSIIELSILRKDLEECNNQIKKDYERFKQIKKRTDKGS